jgi:6,7-dimethyl-8-ribityllumazine synthase
MPAMILILTSRFREEVARGMEESASKVLEKAGEPYEIIEVGGAVELPLAAQHFIRTRKPDGVIALGCVIKGETDHYDWVWKSCMEGLTRVTLDESTPIMHGVQVAHSLDLAMERRSKGAEYAETVLKMKKLLQS